MPETKIDTTEIDAEIAAAEAHLSDLVRRRKAMMLAPFGVAEGDPVIGTGRHEGKSGVAEKIDVFSRGKPWLHVRLRKKDGSIGDRVVWFGTNWERAA